MIKNGKYFIPPPPKDEVKSFKEMFNDLTSAGAGRPVDADGIPEGRWTPELLSLAISDLAKNTEGVERRTVQLWFQDNDKGISNNNLRWLARIFGCDDPSAVSEWQRVLVASHNRFVIERRQRRGAKPNVAEAQGEQNAAEATLAVDHSPEVGEARDVPNSIGHKLDYWLEPKRAENLIFVSWFVYAALVVLNFAIGTLSVTYEPLEGLNKQVGFITAPSLTVLPILVIPACILTLSRLIAYWKKNKLVIYKLAASEVRVGEVKERWSMQLQSYSLMFKSAAALCFIVVFGLQWAAIYLPIYITGDAGSVQIDRYLVTLFRPDVVSVQEAVVLSFIGYLYTASFIFLYLIGLVFLHVITSDFSELVSKVEQKELPQTSLRQIVDIRDQLLLLAYAVFVSGIWIATCVRLQVAYLSSDGADFWSWLANDILFIAGLAAPSGWLEQGAVNFTTTVLMALLSWVVMAFAFTKTSLFRLTLRKRSYSASSRLGMVFGAIVVGTNTMFAGLYSGFSILTILSFVVLLYCLWRQYFIRIN